MNENESYNIPSKVRRDLPVVAVRGDLGRALRELHRRRLVAGDSTLLKERALHPAPGDRRRSKRRRADKRRRKAEARGRA